MVRVLLHIRAMKTTATAEEQSRRVAEEARERTWAGRSFLREIFLGNFHYEWISPFPRTDIRPRALAFLEQLKAFLETSVDSEMIDRTGEYPREVLRGLADLGAFGMKIPEKFGGLGFTDVEYARALELCAQYDANVVALLSAHQSIGVPQPLMQFGTEAQKEKYLPMCARGAVSAFALTEPNVGSDPASLSTTATKTEDGDYILEGEKLWCTNGTIAEIVVVMARDDNGRISAFLVETTWPGVEIGQRCRFMGLRAIENGVLRFQRVRVPKENLIGKEGDGLRIALVTLNTGRLALPAGCAGFTKRCTEIVRRWSSERVQWGRAIGRHEAIAHKIADIASTTFAIDSMTRLATELSLREKYDIRLEAAAAKEWATVRGWYLVDQTMQIRGGRGYETEASLGRRGEPAIPVERMMRDSRINLIFEGSSEIMHLFMAREAVDKHLDLAGPLVDRRATLRQKLRAVPALLFFYLWWFPVQFIEKFWAPLSGALSQHLWYCERASRKLARSIFYGMLIHRKKLEYRQAFLFRIVDIANEIFAIAASVARARLMLETSSRNAASALELADAFGISARRRIERSFYELWHNDDRAMYSFAGRVLDGRHEWIERVVGSNELPLRGPDDVEPEPSGLTELALDVEQHAPLPAGASGVDAVAAVMCSILQRLDATSMDELTRVLPADFHSTLRVCPVHALEDPSNLGVAEQVAEHLGTDISSAEKTTAVVLEALLQRLEPDGADRVARILPDEVRHPKASAKRQARVQRPSVH